MSNHCVTSCRKNRKKNKFYLKIILHYVFLKRPQLWSRYWGAGWREMNFEHNAAWKSAWLPALNLVNSKCLICLWNHCISINNFYYKKACSGDQRSSEWQGGTFLMYSNIMDSTDVFRSWMAVFSFWTLNKARNYCFDSKSGLASSFVPQSSIVIQILLKTHLWLSVFHRITCFNTAIKTYSGIIKEKFFFLSF